MNLIGAIRYRQALDAYMGVDHLMRRKGLKDVRIESGAQTSDEHPNLQKIARGPLGLTLSWSMRYRNREKRPDPVVCVEFRVTFEANRAHALTIEHNLVRGEWSACLADPDTDPNHSGEYPLAIARLLGEVSVHFQAACRVCVDRASAMRIIERMADAFLAFERECG